MQMQSTQYYPEATVGTLIFDPAGRLFLMQSHKWAGRYVLPGGHVELGETLEAALRREVAEETGLTIHDVTFVGVQEFIYDPATGGAGTLSSSTTPVAPTRRKCA